MPPATRRRASATPARPRSAAGAAVLSRPRARCDGPAARQVAGGRPGARWPWAPSSLLRSESADVEDHGRDHQHEEQDRERAAQALIELAAERDPPHLE